MKDREYAAQKRRVLRIIKWWRDELGLRWWHINWEFYDNADPQLFAMEDGGRAFANAKVDWPYLDATIDLNMPRAEDYTDDELENALVHEMCHILVREMRDDREHAQSAHPLIVHEERVCTTLASAFIWVRKRAEKDGRTASKTSRAKKRRG